MTEKKPSSTPKTRKTAQTKPTTRKAPARKTETATKKPASKTAAKKPTAETITIDGKTYPVDVLSDSAKAQITNIRAADRLIGELETELAITRTARQRYGEALEYELKSLKTTIQ